MAVSSTRLSISIAPDVNNNQVFVNFWNELSVTWYRLKLDEESAVGIVFRGK